MKVNKFLIFLTLTIVLSYNSYGQDTITKVPNRILARIYTDLSICETSLSSCKAREVSYLQDLQIYNNNENMFNEFLYNDSLVILDLTNDNTRLREDKNILQKSNKNLVKSNNFLKFSLIASLVGIIALILVP